jgi:hypothetical protein
MFCMRSRCHRSSQASCRAFAASKRVPAISPARARLHGPAGAVSGPINTSSAESFFQQDSTATDTGPDYLARRE